MNFELALLGVGLLLVVSVFASRASGILGVPALILFISIGMLAGSDGPGKIYFDDAALTQHIGIVALAFILFSGGISTHWSVVRPALGQAISLATLGVFITAGITGAVAFYGLHFGMGESLLIGSIVASTDAAAVFSVLKGQGLALREDVQSLLELESGINDPMAVFLTLGLVSYLKLGTVSPLNLLGSFIVEMALGLLVGVFAGRLGIFLIRKVSLDMSSIYPVVSVAVVLVSFAAASLVHGNGFLSVYVAGLVLGSCKDEEIPALRKFHESLAWLMQIGMFIVLGLLVFPKSLPPVALTGCVIAATLIFVSRPIGTMIALGFSKLEFKARVLVSWAGLRGAVPIVLATYPLIAGVPKAQLMFDVVFFVVLTSALVQGTSLPKVAKLLKLNES